MQHRRRDEDYAEMQNPRPNDGPVGRIDVKHHERPAVPNRQRRAPQQKDLIYPRIWIPAKNEERQREVQQSCQQGG